MWDRKIWFSFILMTAAQVIHSEECRKRSGQCRPVFLFHGALEDNIAMMPIGKRITEMYPETDIFNSNAYPDALSFTPMWDQINGTLGQEFVHFCAKHPEGITLIGHSQGAIMSRALIQVFSNHCVHTFISIAGPLAGQFGIPKFFPLLVYLTQLPIVNTQLSEFFYLRRIQETISLANYWKDPYRFLEYLEKNIFMPLINNEKCSFRSKSFKDGFLKPCLHVTIGGPQDAVVMPWQSSHYSFYARGTNQIEDYKDSAVYKQDLFGLQTIDTTGRLIRHVFDGVEHYQFLTDKKVFEEAILPYLDCTKKIDP